MPEARILRMDTDTTSSRYSFEKNFNSFGNGEYDILVGTQMVAKGLNFPDVTLVGVLNIDQMLFNDDYKSGERAFDLITQVVGRSGRGVSPGKAYIQTSFPDSEIVTMAKEQDYESFFDVELPMRKAMIYPPFCDICTLTFTSEQFNQSIVGAKLFFEMIKTAVTGEFSDVKINLLGPLQPRVSKINNKYRNVITIKCKNNKRLRSMISSLLVAFMKDKLNNGVTVTADINPL